MLSTSPPNAITAVVVVLFALLFASAFVALYVHIRRRRFANNSTPLPTHMPSTSSTSEIREKTSRKWKLTPQSWKRTTSQGSMLHGLHSLMDDRHMENEYKKNEEWLDRIRCMVEEANASPGPQQTPKCKFVARYTPRLCNRQRSNSSISRPSLLDAWSSITSRSSPRPRSLSESSALSPRAAEKTQVPGLSTFRMSLDWELEQARLTNRMLASGVPMPWTPYVPSQPVYASTLSATNALEDVPGTVKYSQEDGASRPVQRRACSTPLSSSAVDRNNNSLHTSESLSVFAATHHRLSLNNAGNAPLTGQRPPKQRTTRPSGSHVIARLSRTEKENTPAAAVAESDEYGL